MQEGINIETASSNFSQDGESIEKAAQEILKSLVNGGYDDRAITQVILRLKALAREKIQEKQRELTELCNVL